MNKVYKTISIIIPAYNEVKTIESVISKVKNLKFKNLKKQIIVVDDGSNDGTRDLISKMFGVDVILHEKNKGKGGALKTGISSASGDIITFQDADLEYDPEDLKKLIVPIISNKALVTYGSRFLSNKKYSSIFFLGNKFLSFTTTLFYGQKITDMETCYKVFDAELLKSIKFESLSFDFEPEITAKVLKRKIRIIELPIEYYPRNAKEGKKIKISDGFKALYVLLKNRF